jgi:hypothetical protein
MTDGDESTAGDSLTSEPQPGTGRHDEVDFAPADLTDGREEDEWESRYTQPKARRQLAAEAVYLAVLIFGAAFALLLIWRGTPRSWLARIVQ